MSALKDLALLAAIKTFAAGKRWQVSCGICGTTVRASDVNELGRALLAHGHSGKVGMEISSL